MIATSRIEEVSYGHIVMLAATKALPLGVGGEMTAPRRPARSEELSGIRWLVSGNPLRPSALMALRPYYDPHSHRDTLEVLSVIGLKMGVKRLLLRALEMARTRGVPLSGEIAADNTALRLFMQRLGARYSRLRYEVGG